MAFLFTFLYTNYLFWKCGHCIYGAHLKEKYEKEMLQNIQNWKNVILKYYYIYITNFTLRISFFFVTSFFPWKHSTICQKVIIEYSNK